jgi:hypothetical protein
MINLIKNIWFFRKELSSHTGSDFLDSLSIFKRSLDSIYQKMLAHKGKSFILDKKIDKMKRAIDLIDRLQSADYHDLSLKQINLEFKSSPAYNEEITFSRFNDENNIEEIHKAITLSIELEERDWIKLWTLLKNSSYGLRSWYI